ncbi:MAG TPA: hypothetical protein VMV95_00200 [Bacillota bacterium]|nr:hypothetical protein [Bacillota bacterium]
MESLKQKKIISLQKQQRNLKGLQPQERRIIQVSEGFLGITQVPSKSVIETKVFQLQQKDKNLLLRTRGKKLKVPLQKKTNKKDLFW